MRTVMIIAGKTKKPLLITAGLLIMPHLLFGQDIPCDGNDPYATCPLDTWVYLFAAVILILTIMHMLRKQKTPGAIRVRAKNNRWF